MLQSAAALNWSCISYMAPSKHLSGRRVIRSSHSGVLRTPPAQYTAAHAGYLPGPRPERRWQSDEKAEYVVAAIQREHGVADHEGSSGSGDEGSSGSGGRSGGNMFQNLVGNLLTGAASRLERGPTTCLDCRGTGTRTCTACKGSGVLKQAQIAKMMKTAGRKSNRCPKCSGYGRTACPTCHGRGFRGDFSE